MTPTLAVPLFLILTVGWISLALLPAIHELRRKTDAEPLKVVRRSETDIRHFANGFREFLHRHFTPLLADCMESGLPVVGSLEDGTPFRMLPEGREKAPALGNGSGDTRYQELTLACGNLHLPGDRAYLREVYSRGSLHAGDGAALRAALAEQSVYFGENCTTFRWLHAGADIHAEPGCRFFGRVSADRTIKLADDCRFERLHAPRIEFGTGEKPQPPEPDGARLDLENHPRLQDYSAGRYLFRGNFDIQSDSRVEGDVVATGKLRIRDGAHIVGSVKADGDLEIGRGVRIEGAVVAGHNMALGAGCILDGPVVAEHKAEIGPSCHLGTQERPTTLSARGLKIGPGVVAHGTVWGGDA